MRKRRKTDSGVTLTEILIVIGIIAFLAVLVTVGLRSQVFKGRDARRKGDLHFIKVAVEEYEKDHNCYPSVDLVVCDPGTGLDPYISKIPCDPITGESYRYVPSGDICPHEYWIYTDLENNNDNEIEALGCGTGCGPGFVYDYYVSSSGAAAPAAHEGPTPPPGSGDHYCQSIGSCVFFNNVVWDCTPAYTSEDCNGDCATRTGSCTLR